MKPEELRIGNYVTWADQDITTSDSVLTVIGIVLNDTIWLEWEWEDGTNDNTDCGIDSIKPIPITEQWLIDFGFRFEQTINSWTNGYYDILITNNGKFIIDEIYNCPEIEHIHQLQNLYFALTGEELQLKQSTT